MDKQRSKLEIKKIEIAKDYVSKHKDNEIVDWATGQYKSDDDDWLYIYALLIGGAYGNVTAVDETYNDHGDIISNATEFETEINGFSTRDGNPLLFRFDAVGEEA